MKSYSETDIFNQDDLEILRVTTKIVEALPEPLIGPAPWRCHEVARAVHRALERVGIKTCVIDGRFAGAQHTWLGYRSGEDVRLLDVYAVGRLPMVQLVDPSWSRGLGYAPGHLPRTDVNEAAVSLLEEAATMAMKSEAPEATREEIAALREFYKLAAKVECEGQCGKFIPVMEDTKFGSRLRHSEWLCPPCHENVCGTGVTEPHNCQALR